MKGSEFRQTEDFKQIEEICKLFHTTPEEALVSLGTKKDLDGKISVD